MKQVTQRKQTIKVATPVKVETVNKLIELGFVVVLVSSKQK